jgi:hypothetical protein
MAPFTSFKVISRSGGKWIGILAHLGRALETVSGLKRHRSRFGTGCPLFCGAPSFEDRSGEVAEPRSHQEWSSDFEAQQIFRRTFVSGVLKKLCVTEIPGRLLSNSQYPDLGS